ncbi:hypothetical protein ANOM_000942 [Aspergillus nomiae NRRL 13137]|uniref:Benzoate 4-monooxygenase cytochrome P450 n=1 Tax=Aspergillus nomiae NRRL (strain ATCC 15546 / NRRL 13137 / CBS 260.88 / M93) TaxID=1509407 RepID=A0A0L1JGH3_ASPN3|nr:uncharacterized protein ANOM_000942 [Aspergillus nomiae NRRL 13137]KNG90869.1 hypothetical protein ANOM_000942 [Aspergillus nomiae NRRL 13137]
MIVDFLSQNLFYSPVTLSVILSIFVIAWLVIQPLYFGPLSHIPGPWINKISSIYLTYYDVRLQRNDKIMQWHRQYGPVICISPGEVSAATLSATREIYGSSGRCAKSNYFHHFTAYNEQSIFATLCYKEHREKRKLTSGFYQASMIYKRPDIEGYTRRCVQKVLQQLRQQRHSGKYCDIYALSDWYGFDIITYLTLGKAHGTQTIERDCTERRILRDLKTLQLWGPFRLRFPKAFELLSSCLRYWMPMFTYLKSDTHLAEWAYNRVSDAAQYSDSQDPCSLFQRLMALTDGSKSTGGGRQNYIAAEILDNINAAEATVSVTVAYFFYHLSQEVKWQEEIRKELLKLPPQSDGLPSFTQLNEAPILEACLNETYRLYPASSGRAERVVPDEGKFLSGTFVPADTIVTTSLTAMHRDKEIFPSPESFLPQRWLNSDPVQREALERHIIPFGYGARICLGKPLATLEIKLLIAGIFLQYRTIPAPSCLAESMRQSSTHDAVPWGLKCELEFHPLI